jgi:hypothetical protein
MSQSVTHVLVLEQLGGSKKQSCGLLGSKILANVQQVHDASEQRPAFSWANWRFIENTGLLYDCSFVIVVGAETLLLLFRESCHGR